MYLPNSSLLAVATSEAESVQSAQALAGKLALPYFFITSSLKFVSEYDYLLLQEEAGIAIAKTGKGAPKPFSVDFTSGAVDHRRRFGGGKGQDIAKAVGLNKRNSIKVLDATAGLGRDAFVLASLGCQVDLCERVPFVRSLLEDGLKRAESEAEVADIIARMQLLSHEMHDLPSSTQYDVVYLDPMFPHMEKSSAAAKKEMAFFRDLVGADLDADNLLSKALLLAKYRVVVKRPKSAPYLAQTNPTYQLEGKSGRFDVYVQQSFDQSV